MVTEKVSARTVSCPSPASFIQRCSCAQVEALLSLLSRSTTEQAFLIRYIGVNPAHPTTPRRISKLQSAEHAFDSPWGQLQVAPLHIASSFHLRPHLSPSAKKTLFTQVWKHAVGHNSWWHWLESVNSTVSWAKTAKAANQPPSLLWRAYAGHKSTSSCFNWLEKTSAYSSRRRSMGYTWITKGGSH